MSQLRELYERALDVPAAERGQWLELNCADAAVRARLQALLEAESDDEVAALRTPAAERLALLAPDEVAFAGAEHWIGRRVGAFRLRRLIGEGGMAVVFLAEREGADFEQEVAVKLLRRGLFSSVEQQLFRRERQALATLSHPNIARLIDGGFADDGVPFLAMEYVAGLPLTRYCIEGRVGVRERVLLLATACRAVEAAHRALIVHRDLKPSNILVDAEGTVKLLDFGIAKLLDDDAESATRTGLGALTPEYAAPEQFAGGPITTATDVYALGVLLHELLLGERPSAAPPPRPSSRVVELAAVAERLPAPPLALRSMLRGDLDNVILKALEREPQRRYASAGAMADDLDRFLGGRPVAAHPPSKWYRTRKFVQRHRGGVALTALLLLGMIAGLLATLWQTHVARQQALRANAVRDFLIDALDAGKAELPRDQRPGLDDLIKAARERIDTDTKLDPQTRAELLHTLGEITFSSGDYDGAKVLLSRAIQARDALYPPGAPERLASRVRLADVLIANGELAPGRKLLEEVVPHLDRMVHQVAVEAWLGYAGVLLQTGEQARGLELVERGAALADQVFGADSREALSSHLLVGDALAKAQRNAEAAEILEPAIRHWREAGYREDFKLSVSMSNLALAKSYAGDHAGAVALLEEVLALRRRIFTAPHDKIASALGNLGSLHLELGQLGRATELYEQSLAMRGELFGADHRALVPGLANLGAIARRRRDFAAAERWYREALRICEASGEINSSTYPTVLHNLAYTQLLADQPDAAEQTAQRALAIYRRVSGEKHNASGNALALLGQIAIARHQPKLAVERVDDALRILEGDRNTARQSILLSRFTRAEALLDSGRAAEAGAQIDAVISEWRQSQQHANDRLVAMLALRARIQLAGGDTAAARRSATEALALDVDRALLQPETLKFLESTR